MKIELYVKEHNITGMKYFGKHKVCSISINEYLGSGKFWIPHLEKYGNDVTTYSVGVWDEEDPELEYAALSLSGYWDIVNSNEWANLKLENGLDGGWDYVNSIKTPEEIKEHTTKAWKESQRLWFEDEEWRNKHINEIRNGIKSYYANGGQNGFLGKNHTSKTKNTLSETQKNHNRQNGSKNSQYGKRFKWMNNGHQNKKVNEKDVQTYLNNGYVLGMK